jgi:tRNA threonylcarbamoyladenosine biosynthesis protein TsaB
LALILIIDSAFEQCVVALSNNEEVIAHEESIVQKDHASFLQPAIKKVCDTASLNLSSIDAIAVVNGPGSYTGLRVGLASAKGIAYVLNKPLLLLNTLDILAFALQKEASLNTGVLFCPMIDARRMEVLTALYNSELKLLKDYTSVVLDEDFLCKEKSEFQVMVGGNGSPKLKNFKGFENIIFGPLTYNVNHVIQCALQKYKTGNFASLAYSEPFYIKPVYVK